jgi:hypothetical protein
MDSKSDSPLQSLVVMPPGTQGSGMPSNMAIPDHPAWNPNRIFEQWQTTFGTAVNSESPSTTQESPLNFGSSPGAMETPSLQDIQAVNAPALPQQQFSAPTATFVTPAMWQESVASVYEGGLKRNWDFNPEQIMKRR